MDKYIPCRWMTSFVYLRNLATSDIPISGFPGWLRVISLTVVADSIYNILIFFAEKMSRDTLDIILTNR